MYYPAKLTCEEDGCTLQFLDVPEAITCGATEAEAMLHAADALESALDFYFSDRWLIPLPSRRKQRQKSVELTASISAKVLLHNELLTQKVRPAELARRLKIDRQDVNRLLNPRHATKIDTVAAALRALGKTLELEVR